MYATQQRQHGASRPSVSCRAMIAAAVAAIAAFAVQGCYVNHEPVLMGERYTCLCHYDRETWAWDLGWERLPDGGTKMTGDLERGTPERGLTELIHPCSTFAFPEGDEAEYCGIACAEWDRYPPGYIAGSGRYEDGSPAYYEGAGACDPQGIPPRSYIWPGVPPNAVRNGILDTENSAVSVTVSGIGASFIVPESGYITVSGGACEISGAVGSMACPPVTVFDFGFTLPEFELGGADVTNVRVAQSGVDPVAGPFTGLYSYEPVEDHDTWSYSTGMMPLEADGLINGFPMDARFDYGSTPGFEHPDGDAISLRQGPSWEKFIQFSGMVFQDDVGSSGHNIQIEFDLRFDFFSGAPLVHAAYTSSPYSPYETILDGTGTVDDLGGTPVLYEWFLSDPMNPAVDPAVIGYGERVSVPTALLENTIGNVQFPYTDICLRVWDSDDYYDEHCTVWPIIPGPPPAIGCADVGLSWANTYRFRRIVERSGLVDTINNYPSDFTMLVPTNALLDAFAALGLEIDGVPLEEWALESEYNATAFVAYFSAAAFYPWSSFGPISLWGVPAKAQAVDRGCGNGNPGPRRVMHIIGPDL